MVLQKIYVQYEYQYSGYLLPDAELYVRDSMTSGELFGEICYSAFDGVSTGCGFNLTEGWTYDVFSGKEGYKTGSDSQLLEFPPPVNPYILLWLYPCEPTVVTHDATEITTTTVKLNGEVTDMDGLSRAFAGFQYGKVGESYTQGEEWPSDYPEAIWDYLSDLTPGTTYNFRTRVSNITDEDTFYVFGDTKQFTTLPATEPPVVDTYDTDEITETGALLRGYLGASGGILTAVGFEYGKTTSYGITLWTGESAAPGYYTEAITSLDPDTLYHVRAIAENDYGTGYGVDKTFTTLEAAVYTMHIVLPNANGKLFLSDTIIACDDHEKACTEFRFQIQNDGNVPMAAWYKVSVVGGETLYDSSIASLSPGTTSAVIDDMICALIPGGLPVGTHTIKVETGPEGLAATGSYTEPLYVTEEQVIEPPRVMASSASGVTQSSAILNALLTYTGDVSTHIGFEYGKTTSYGTTIWDKYTSTTGYYEKEVTGLEANTTYHFRPIVTNEYGTDYSVDKTFTTLVEPTHNMHIVLPNANGKLFLSDTIIACDDHEKACTEFRFHIRNDGNVAKSAWYKVSVVGGETLYDSTIASLNPGATSAVIGDIICALPDGLPVGTHTIKLEIGPEGLAATDSHTEPLYVTEEQVIEPPRVMASSASGVTQSSAILNALLTYTGDVSTHIGFEYGKTTSYGTTIWDKYTSTTGYYEKEVTGLEANTTYHFRPIVTNEYGTDYSVDKTFTTLSAAFDITFIATAPGISDLHNVDVNDVTDPGNPKYLGRT